MQNGPPTQQLTQGRWGARTQTYTTTATTSSTAHFAEEGFSRGGRTMGGRRGNAVHCDADMDEVLMGLRQPDRNDDSRCVCVLGGGGGGGGMCWAAMCLYVRMRPRLFICNALRMDLSAYVSTNLSRHHFQLASALCGASERLCE